MTDEQINVAIGEVCGWIPSLNQNYGDIIRPGKTEHNPRWRTMPDYCHDLNAMHEAEKTLDREYLDLYADQVLSMIHEVDPGYFNRINWGHAVELLTATARQRAESFLRTLGKWKD